MEKRTLCLLLSGEGMASSCRKYSSTWTCGAEREGPVAQSRRAPRRTQGRSRHEDRQAGRVLGAPAKSRGGSRGPPSPPLSASWPCPLTSATSPARLGGSHWQDMGVQGCGGGQAEATGPGPVGEATVPGT